MSELGTEEKPFLTGHDGDRAYRWCRCNTCGTVAACLPTFDFFYAAVDPSRTLHCRPCFELALAGKVRLQLLGTIESISFRGRIVL